MKNGNRTWCFGHTNLESHSICARIQAEQRRWSISNRLCYVFICWCALLVIARCAHIHFSLDYSSIVLSNHHHLFTLESSRKFIELNDRSFFYGYIPKSINTHTFILIVLYVWYILYIKVLMILWLMWENAQ